jgi:hypothetical protein
MTNTTSGTPSRKIQLNMNTIALVIIGITLVALFLIARYQKTANKKSAYIKPKIPKNYNNVSLGHASSSIDSERQFGFGKEWKGKSSKCYDCEKDMAQRCGDSAVFNATKQKLFT